MNENQIENLVKGHLLEFRQNNGNRLTLDNLSEVTKNIMTVINEQTENTTQLKSKIEIPSSGEGSNQMEAYKFAEINAISNANIEMKKPEYVKGELIKTGVKNGIPHYNPQNKMFTYSGTWIFTINYSTNTHSQKFNSLT